MIVTVGLLFIALILIGVGIWFVVNTDRYTGGVTATVINEPCQIAPGPGPAPGPAAAPTCDSKYSFKVDNATYMGKLEEKLTTSTVDISYDPSDPNISRKGDPDNKYLGPVLIGSGVVTGVIGVAFSLR
jgi:hypothetical protein